MRTEIRQSSVKIRKALKRGGLSENTAKRFVLKETQSSCKIPFANPLFEHRHPVDLNNILFGNRNTYTKNIHCLVRQGLTVSIMLI